MNRHLPKAENLSKSGRFPLRVLQCIHCIHSLYSVILFFNPGIALSENESVIEGKILQDNQTLAFLLKDIRKMYQEHFKSLEASDEFIKNGNVTRLEEDI